jgi:glucose/arabinose dehydrogenase
MTTDSVAMRARAIRGLTVIACVASLAAGRSAAQAPAAPPRPAAIPSSGAVPRETRVEGKLQAQFKAPDGFAVTLFAGPPIAMYPTCVAEGGDALFVCVDPNLSLSTLKNVGRVMRLVDDDKDGRADRYTVFAEMDSPRGAVFDGRTLYVMHPPSLSAYRDTTGDGIADEIRELVSGIGFDLDFRGADHTTNNIQLGIDGWLYVAVGDYGFVRAVGSDGTQLQLRGGGVVRVRPDGSNLELYAAGTRNIYDVAIDPFLNLFARDNTNDGDGWNTRLHHIAPGAHLGYPNLYKNFGAEHYPSLFDYGAGSGVGALWIQDPAWPSTYNNALYTADWTVQKIFRHPLTPKGASFTVGQEEFINVLRPADLVMDGSSNLYVASLAGGQFTYNSDTVGYVVRVSHGAAPRTEVPRVATLTDAQLVSTVASSNAIHRLHAQQELLRRLPNAATLNALRQATSDSRTSAEARVAAIFTLAQIPGADAHASLRDAAGARDPRVRAAALRALTDRREQLAGVPSSLFAAALADTSGHVRAQAITSVVRLGARDLARHIVPLTASNDSALQHLAVNAVATLQARDVALGAVDAGPSPVRVGALRALAKMHDAATVSALLERVDRTRDAAVRAELLHALARLYNREGPWRGDWWGTKPPHLGPYFDPAMWEESPRIRPVLTRALVAARGPEAQALTDDYVLQQVLPRGAQSLLAAVGDDDRTRAIQTLVGRSQLDLPAVALVTELSRKSPALQVAVAQLLAAEATVSAAALPLARLVVLDTNVEASARGRLLTGLGQASGPRALQVATEVFAQLNPKVGTPAPVTPAGATAAAAGPPGGANAAGANPIESAWRRFVGDRRRQGELDYFIAMAGRPGSAQRTLAFAVLLQSIRSPRTPAPVREKVAPVIEAAWSDPTAARSVAEAIRLMRLESAYAERLQAYERTTTP